MDQCIRVKERFKCLTDQSCTPSPPELLHPAPLRCQPVRRALHTRVTSVYTQTPSTRTSAASHHNEDRPKSQCAATLDFSQLVQEASHGTELPMLAKISILFALVCSPDMDDRHWELEAGVLFDRLSRFGEDCLLASTNTTNEPQIRLFYSGDDALHVPHSAAAKSTAEASSKTLVAVATQQAVPKYLGARPYVCPCAQRERGLMTATVRIRAKHHETACTIRQTYIQHESTACRVSPGVN